MKRRLHRLGGAAAVTALTVAPGLVRADVPGLNQKPEEVTIKDVVNVLVYLVEFGLAFAAATGMIFIVISGYQYVLSAGNPEKVEKAKQGLTWSITGFILAISSTAIVFLLQKSLLAKHTVNEQLGNVEGPDTAQQVLEALLDLGFGLAGMVAVLFLILGGYRYITSQGNRDEVESAQKTILYSMIGLVVVFTSFMIFKLIANAVQANL